MLNLIPTSWIRSLTDVQLLWSWSPSPRYAKVACCYLRDDLRPYVFGNKPRASRKNLFGNRAVNHLQYHGSLAYGEHIFPPKTDIGSFRIVHDGYDVEVVAIVPNRPKSQYTHDFVHEFGKSREAYRTVIFYRNGSWGIAELRYAINFHYSGTTGPYNFMWSCQSKTNIVNGDFAYNWYTNRSTQGYIVGLTSTDEDPDIVFTSLIKRVYAWYDITRPEDLRGYKRAMKFPLDVKPHFFKSSELASIKRAIRMQSLRLDPSPDYEALLGEATQQAADRVRYFDGNTAVYIKELFELKDAVLDLYHLLKGKVDAKSLSDLWVSSQYGLRLTALDTIDLLEAIDRKLGSDPNGLFSVSRGTAQDGNLVCHSKLYYDPNTRNGLAKVSANLFEWDLFPSLQNVWDIVPYSFVVDWFVDVEGFLTAIDTRTYMSCLNIIGTLYSLKYEWDVQFLDRAGIIGRFVATRFRRFSRKEPVEPRPTFSGSLPSTKNIVTGAALIIQRSK